jgi:hypothetical protein
VQLGAKHPVKLLPYILVGATLQKGPKMLKIPKKPYKYAKRTLHLFQNAIRSFVFLLQSSDEPTSTIDALAAGTIPLGPG